MTTEECINKKICLFCASDYHLELILLPYIKEKINDSKIIIFTEKSLEESLKKLLEKTNLNKNFKEKIIEINWKNEDKFKEFENEKNYRKLKNEKNIKVIVNGEYEYIQRINNSLKEFEQDIEIVNCFHVGDPNVNIEEIRGRYKYILNTQKI